MPGSGRIQRSSTRYRGVRGSRTLWTRAGSAAILGGSWRVCTSDHTSRSAWPGRHVPVSHWGKPNVYTVEAVQERVIGVIADLTGDWDVEIEGGMGSGTTMVGDVGFAS